MMLNKFENLSLEILLKIFNYLSIEQCFHSFTNLNSYFNSSLIRANYSIDLTAISRRTYDDFYDQTIFPYYAEQIRKLKLSNNLTLGLLEQFFSDYYLEDFHRLRSLTLINPSYMTLGTFALILPKLEQLEHLAVHTCTAYPSNFFRLITTTSLSLKSCFLPQLELDDEITFQSNIQCLSVTIEDLRILLSLLSKFTNLSYFHVLLKSTLYDELPELEHISCENLENFKMNISDKSSIDFNEIEYFFRQITFMKLKSFSYNSITHSLEHLNVSKWNRILQPYSRNLDSLYFFIQIPIDSYSISQIKSILDEFQTSFFFPSTLAYAINSTHYLIYTNDYPKKHYHLSEINDDIDLNSSKFSKIRSLTVDTRICTSLPSTIKHLQIQIEPNNFKYLLQDCSKQLMSLKLIGLPEHLPTLPNLKELTIQRTMFNLSMAKALPKLCPRLQLLTCEIDCLKQFDDILKQLRTLNQLKFIRIFSRDANQTWANWIDERKDLLMNVNCDTKTLFLFLWL